MTSLLLLSLSIRKYIPWGKVFILIVIVDPAAATGASDSSDTKLLHIPLPSIWPVLSSIKIDKLGNPSWSSSLGIGKLDPGIIKLVKNQVLLSFSWANSVRLLKMRMNITIFFHKSLMVLKVDFDYCSLINKLLGEVTSFLFCFLIID